MLCGQYIAAFGVVPGVRLFVTLRAIPSLARRLKTNSGKQIRVWVPGVRSRVAFRLNTTDVVTFEQIFLEKQYSGRQSSAREKASTRTGFSADEKEIKFIIDGGANAGYSSLYFANRYPHAQIIAVEPEASNFECLTANVQDYGNIKPLQAAIWPEPIPLRINNPGEQKYAFQVGEEGGPAERNIKGVTIAQLMAQLQAERIDILKLDVEGAEEQIFGSNFEPWLGNVNTIYIELHDWMKPGCGENFRTATARYNFAVSQRGEITILTRPPGDAPV